jgi:hypothetical protein
MRSAYVTRLACMCGCMLGMLLAEPRGLQVPKQVRTHHRHSNEDASYLLRRELEAKAEVESKHVLPALGGCEWNKLRMLLLLARASDSPT